MSERPNVFVTYQDAPRNTHMGCLELFVSAVVLLAMAGMVLGWSGLFGLLFEWLYW